jgi:hypothetical protein
MKRLALREARKREWLDYRGGMCVRCHYKFGAAALVFHHVGPKKFAIPGGGDSRYATSQGTSGHTREEILEELNACIVLCNRCHSELHHGCWKLDDLT